MTASEVEKLVQSVVVDRGLSFALLTVDPSPAGWNIKLRAYSGSIVSLTIRDGRPVTMRGDLQEQLEEQA